MRLPTQSAPSRAALHYTAAIMLKNLILCLKLALVFAAIVFFAKALQYLIFNGGLSGEFYDYLFFRK
ncbi:hypothetical protein [Herbaspirillum seropedicae]|jgi:hypothetical protein|uniref:hypothetical protein n=1 Tax=Herbaspirillum seropedicae TaxID=964 RepID=UPI000ABF2CA4